MLHLVARKMLPETLHHKTSDPVRPYSDLEYLKGFRV